MTAEPRSLPSQQFENSQAPRPRRPKSGGGGKWLFLFLTLAMIGGVGAATYLVWSASQVEDLTQKAEARPVGRGTLVISVVEDGNMESASNVELKCEVEGTNTTILSITPDGTEVNKGDQLVKLDSSSIEEAIDQQKITLEEAHAALITAEKDHSSAAIAVDEYREGTLKQSLEQMEADITQAKQNLSSAENTLIYTKKMARDGYVTPLELESKKSLVLQAKLNLGVVELKKTVLEDYTSKKTLEELEGKRDSLEAKMKGQKSAHELQVKKLKRLETNLSKCTIIAPQDGMVVYANETGNMRGMGGQQGPKIEEGAAVRQYQAIIRLPDLSRMQVKTLVHESKVDMLRPGMRANVKIQDRDYQGTVKQVATQPEAGNWFASNVKEYATIVTIDGSPDDLKPGMTAQVEILVAEKKDVLSVPVQTVVEQGKKFYAWVKTKSNPEKRPVVLGSTNDTFIEIKDGLLEGEQVLLNPRAIVSDAREDVPQEESVDVSKKFGATKGTVQAPNADAPKPPVKGDAAAAQSAEAPAQGGAAAAGAPGAVALDGGSPASGGPGGGGRGGGGPGGGGRGRGGPGGGQWKMPTFKDLDKNADGKISEDEISDERMKRGFSMWDGDSDGTVSRKEFDEAMARMKEMMKRMQEGGGGFGGGGGPPQ